MTARPAPDAPDGKAGEPIAEPAWRLAWAKAAQDLPHAHAAWRRGEPSVLPAVLGGLPPVPAAGPQGMDRFGDGAARLAAIDILMVEAAARTQGLWDARPDLEGAVLRAAEVAGRRLGIPPIISYPLYIVHNPPAYADLRRFTGLDAELRFVRMHQRIESAFDVAAAHLRDAMAAPDWPAALARCFDAVVGELKVANRLMSGFRDAVRMPPREFADEFRPYFGLRSADPSVGRPALEGPSGLQSPAFRLITMTLGLGDAIQDGWTERIASYHEPPVRAQLATCRRERDAGRSLAGRVEARLANGGADTALPKLHPAYARFLPTLVDHSAAQGYVQRDVAATLAAHSVRLGAWPLALPPADDPAPAYAGGRAWARLAAEEPGLVGQVVELEALWLGFCLEHMATTAYQIGHVQGTGGTSGVEFLSLATFRRLFPGLWLSGTGEQAIRRQ